MSVKKRYRRFNLVQTIKSIGASIAMLTPVTAQTAAIAGAITQGASTLPLNASDAYTSVHSFYNLGVLINDPAVNQTRLTNYFTNLPGFYSDTPTIYRAISCSSSTTINGQSNFTNVMNLAGVEYFANSSNDWVQNERDWFGAFGGTLYASPSLGGRNYTPPGFVVYNTQPIEMCSSNMGNLSFFYPNPTAATSAQTVYLTTTTSVVDVTVDDPASDYATFGTGGFLVRTGDLSQPTTVRLSLGGDAVLGTDYAISTTNASGQTVRYTSGPVDISLAAGAYGAFLYIDWLTRSQNQPEKLLTISAIPPTGYRQGIATTLTSRTLPVNIPNVSFTVTSPSALTPGSIGRFTVTRTGGDLSQPLTVSYTTAGSATNGTDYSFLDGSVIIPANQTSVTMDFNAAAQNGSTAVPEKTVVIQPQDTSNSYNLGSSAALNYTIASYNPAAIIVSGPPNGTAPRGQTSIFTVGRDPNSDLSRPLTVNYRLSGSAAPGTDYMAPGNGATGSVTIPAGQSSANLPITVNPEAGPTAKPAQDIALTLEPGNGYGLPTPAPSSSMTIPAYTPASISISAGSGTAPRGEVSNFTINRTGDTTQPLTVRYRFDGSAAPGTDYTSPAQNTVTIPQGATAASVPVFVPAENGSTARPSRAIVMTLLPDAGYAVPTPAPTGTLTIPAYNPSALSVTNDGSGFSVTRPASSTGQPLTVNYNLGGSATPGTDYTVPGGQTGSLTIPAGQTTATLPVSVRPDSGDTAKPARDITFSITPGAGYDSAQAPPSTLSIPAYNPEAQPTITLTPSTPGASTLTPGSTGTGITVTRTGSTTQPLTVDLVSGGTARPGVDYTQFPGQVTIPAGQSSVTMPVNVPRGIDPEANGQTVTLSLAPGSRYQPGADTGVSYTIAVPQPTATNPDPNPADVPLATSQTPSGITVSRPEGSDLSRPVEIPYQVSNGEGNIQSLPGVVTIPAGQTTGTILIQPLPTAKPGEVVTLSMTPPPGYTIADPRIGYVLPTPQPQASVPAPAPVLPEVGLGTGNAGGGNLGQVNNRTLGFNIERQPGSDPSKPVTIRYDVGGTAIPGVDYETLPGSVTLEAGQTSRRVPVRLLKDPSDLQGKTITIRLLDGTEYKVSLGKSSGNISFDRSLISALNGNDNGNGNGNGDSSTTTGSISDGSDSNDSDNGSGGGGLGTAAAVVGGASVLGTGVVAATGGFGGGGLFANACPANFQLPDQVEQLARQVDSDGEVNWERISFSVLPQVNRKPAAQVITLGQFGDSLGKLSLKDVSRITGQDLSSMTLSALLGLNPTATVEDVPGLAELISEAGAENKQSRPIAASTAITPQTQLSVLLSQQPAMRNLTLGEISGVMELELQSIDNWEQIPVGQIPGLAEAPFDELFPCLNEPEPRPRAEGNYDRSRSGQSGSGTASGQ